MWSTLLLQIMCLCECHMNDRAHMCHCGSCSHASLRTAQGQRTGVLKPQKSTTQWAIRNISRLNDGYLGDVRDKWAAGRLPEYNEHQTVPLMSSGRP